MAHTSITVMTELEAVNMMLRGVGEAAVTSLSEATTVEVTQAKKTLSEVNREIQQKGWHFNTEYNVTLTPTAGNQIELGNSVLQVITPSKWTTLRGDQGTMKLYDLEENSFTFTEAITDAKTVTLLAFDDIPQTTRFYIAIRCVRIFQEEILGQVSAEQVNRTEEVEAYAAMLDDEMERAGYNMGTDSSLMIFALKRNRNWR